MAERLAAIRRISTEARAIGGRVFHEVKGDLLSPLTYPLSFKARSSIVYGYLAEIVMLTTGPVCLALTTGELTTAAAYYLVQYAGLGTIWNHPENANRFADKVYGDVRRSRLNYSQSSC